MEEKNTIYNLQAVDVIALFESLRDLNYDPVLKREDTIDRLYFYVSRYAMDGIGYHVGYETFEGYLQIFQKRDFQIAGTPISIFPEIVFPSALIVGDINPAVNEDEYNRGLEDDSEGGYCAPDDDFAYSELEHALNRAIEILPEAIFDKESRVWSCGDFNISI